MKHKDSTDSGVKILQPEPYARPLEAEGRFQRADRAWWSASGILITITVAFAALDAVVLYSILDIAMTQAAWMGFVVAIGIALMLNFLPLVVARYFQYAIYRLQRFALTKAICGVIAFFILFGATVFLRFTYEDLYDSDAQYTALVNEVDTAESEESASKDNGQKSLATVILLSIEPLSTSILGFMLAFLNDNPLQAKIRYLRKRRLELVEAQSDLKASLTSMDGNREQLLKLDEELYLAAQTYVQTHCDQLRAQARFLLSEHLKEPSAISRLSKQYIAPAVDDPHQETEEVPVSDTLQFIPTSA